MTPFASFVSMGPRRRTLALAFVGAAAFAGCAQDGPEQLLERARTSLAKQDTKSAEIHVKNLLQRRPDDGEARAMLAAIHAAHRDPRSAEKEWSRALALGLPADRVLPGLVEARVLVGDAKGALQAAGERDATQPDARAEIAYWRGRAHSMLGQQKEAELAFRSALEVRPDFHRAQVSLIALRAGRGDLAGARTAIDALLTQAPTLSEGQLLKAELQFVQQDLDGAKDSLEKAIDADPNNAQARTRLVSLLVDRNDLAAAQAQHTALAKLTPGQPTTIYLKALIDFRQQRLDAARDGVLAALKVAPDLLPAIALGANVALQQNALEQADTYAKQIAERAPGSLQGARLVAAVALRRGDAERALKTARAIVDRGTDDPVLLGIAGEAALRRNEVAAASDYFERAVRVDPKDAGKRTGLGLARLAAGKTEAGLADLEAAAEVDATATQADLALISARLRARQFDRALAAIDRLQKKQPDTALPHNLRGTALLARGDATAARRSFERALEIDPKFFPAASNLAELDLRDRKPEDARKRLDALVQRDPRNTQASLALAQLVGRTGGSRDDVEKILKQAHAASPDAMEPVLALSQLYLQAGRPRDAMPLLQQALARQPEDRQILDALGTAFLRADDHQQAISTFEKLVRLDARNPSVHLRMGDIKASLGNTAGALASFRQAAELDPKAPAPQFGIAAMLLKDGRKDDARRIATSLQKQLPSSPAGLALEGDLLAADGRWADAATSYRKAGAIASSPQILVKQHQALLRAKLGNDAEAVLRDALRARPDDVAIRLYAGEIAIAAKRWRVAAEHYESVVKASPANVVAMNNLAWSLMELKEPRALEVAETAYARAPESAPIADTYGMVLLASGDARRGVELLRKATTLAPKSMLHRVHLAQALAASGDKAAARIEVDRVLAEAPDSPAANAARALVATF